MPHPGAMAFSLMLPSPLCLHSPPTAAAFGNSTAATRSLPLPGITASSKLPSLLSSRRGVLLSLLWAPFPASAATTMMDDPALPAFRNSNGGVRIQDVLEGDGATASEGDLVEFNYVCRRSNGYFVYSTVNQFTGESSPITLPLDGTTMITGLQKVILEMKPGGKRRAVIPPAAGYIMPNLEPQPREFGPQRSLLSHAKEPLLFEVQLLKIKQPLSTNE